MIIHSPITDSMISLARIKSDEMGELHNSIRSGEGNFVGFLIF